MDFAGPRGRCPKRSGPLGEGGSRAEGLGGRSLEDPSSTTKRGGFPLDWEDKVAGMQNEQALDCPLPTSEAVSRIRKESIPMYLRSDIAYLCFLYTAPAPCSYIQAMACCS